MFDPSNKTRLQAKSKVFISNSLHFWVCLDPTWSNITHFKFDIVFFFLLECLDLMMKTLLIMDQDSDQTYLILTRTE